MMDASTPDPDLSPSLGGDRAVPEEPVAPPFAATDAEAGEPADDGELDVEALREAFASFFEGEGAEVIENLLGTEGAEVIQTLTQIGTLGAGLSNVFSGALQALESQLPQTLAAFGGLFEAVEQAVEQALDPTNDTDRRG